MSCEIYTMEYDGKRLRLERAKDAPLVPLPRPGENFAPGPPWQRHATLGDDERLWCEAWRTPNKSGGLFVLWDFDEPLLLTLAGSNLAFAEGVAYFSRMTTYARYAADVYMHSDEDDEE